jgi:hypothetical protein
MVIIMNNKARHYKSASTSQHEGFCLILSLTLYAIIQIEYD